jgi:hypothetical protein
VEKTRVNLTELVETVKSLDIPSKAKEMRDTYLSEKHSDNLWWVIPSMENLAARHGYQIVFSDDPFSHMDPHEAKLLMNGAAPEMLKGFCDVVDKKIVVSTDMCPDMSIRTLFHELAHMLGAKGDNYSTDEITAESVAYLVCKELGDDTLHFSAPYCACEWWSRNGKWDNKLIEQITNTILYNLR